MNTSILSPAGPGLSAALALLALAVVPISGSAAVQIDDFFDTDLDGVWSGTITVKKQDLPMQLNLNVEPSGGSAFLVVPSDEEVTSTSVFQATVASSSATKVTLTVDFEDPVTRVAAVSTISLDYDAATDTLSGKLTGESRGDIVLQRGDPSVPLQRLWEATLKINGENTFVLLGLTEDSSGSGRFAASTVGGTAVIGGVSGSIAGERNGTKVTFTAMLPAGDIEFDLKLKKKNNQLKGQVDQSSGARLARDKFLPSGGDGKGKPLKAKKATPREIPPGATTSVKLKGAGFGLGALVHTDSPDVEIGAVTANSTKQLTVQVVLGESASGNVSIRVVNSDGQTAGESNALTVVGDDDDGGTTVSFANDVQPIFTESCALAGCHSAASGAAGLVLASSSAFANLVGVPSSEQPSLMRVMAGDAENSYLVRKIRGDSGITGGRMPLNRTPLGDGQTNTIITWINEGAANNRLPR